MLFIIYYIVIYYIIIFYVIIHDTIGESGFQRKTNAVSNLKN